MLAMFLAAVEGTIVATAMPSIVSSLGGFSLYSWVFSIYLLAEAVSIPIYGKLADIFGRKPVFLFGMTLFLLGTALCGLSNSMVQLILCRGLQGIGAGAVMPMATTMVSDLYTLRERPRVQGALSSVWAIASVIGPALGGFIVDQLTWHWVFFVNIPFGIASATILIIYLRENVTRLQPQIDYAGAMILVIAIGALMMMLVQGGTAWAWLSTPTLILAVTSGVSFGLFILQEKRAPEPLLPLDLMVDPNDHVGQRRRHVGRRAHFRAVIVHSDVRARGAGRIGYGGGRAPHRRVSWVAAGQRVDGARLECSGTPTHGPTRLNTAGRQRFAADHGRCGFPSVVVGCRQFHHGHGARFFPNDVHRHGSIASSVESAWRGHKLPHVPRILGSTLWVAMLGGILNQRLHTLLGNIEAIERVQDAMQPAATDGRVQRDWIWSVRCWIR